MKKLLASLIISLLMPCSLIASPVDDIRLTLNILLSFAQFEREVTGERIRDKFAASKKKGMWMGGTPPLGYLIKDRQLVIEETEAELVKKIFNLYLTCRSPLHISQILQQEGHTNKRWQTAAGEWRGGQKMTAGHVNRILRNVTYIGKVKQGKDHYLGQHLPIIDETLWNQVQDSVHTHERESRYQYRSCFLLQGKLKTHEDFLMSPYTHQKAALSQAGNKPRYYVSRKALTQGYAQCPIKSLNADLLEDLITTQVLHYLVENNKPVYDFVTRMTDESQKAHWIRELVESVVIGPELMVMTLSKQAIATTENEINNNPFDSGDDDNATAPPVIWYQPDIREDEDKIILSLSILIRRVNGIRAILSSSGKDLTLPAQPKPDPSVVQAIGRGFSWKQMLNENPKLSFKQFEAKVGYCDSFITKQISLIGLAPDILHRALTGTLPPSIKLNRLYEAAASLSWERQRQLLDLN